LKEFLVHGLSDKDKDVAEMTGEMESIGKLDGADEIIEIADSEDEEDNMEAYIE
jgi:hypothetical protein